MKLDFDLLQARTVALDLLASTVRSDTYRLALDGLANAIRAVSSGINDEDEAAVDDACDLIETLLGAAFLVCQTQITAVTARAMRAREQALKEGQKFGAFGARPKDVHALGAKLAASGIVEVEAIWALGNYFKHREEWPHAATWVPEGSSKVTIEVLTALGLSPGSTGNLRTGAKLLGNADYDNLDAFFSIVDTWGKLVLTEVSKAFGP